MVGEPRFQDEVSEHCRLCERSHPRGRHEPIGRQSVFRVTYDNGSTYTTQPRTFRENQPNLIGIIKLYARRNFPGSTVVRLVRESPDSEWVEWPDE